jgi:dihydroneopterin aldolase
MLTIQLQDLEFFAYHGLYESEKKHGNNFLVDAFISIDANEKIVQIDQTVDYVKVFEIIRDRMQIATHLLETIAQELIGTIYAADKRIKSIEISIKKLTPPIPGFKGTVGVQIKQSF